MTIREIQSYVREGENVTQEFKKKVAFPEKIVREIVAFANTAGGRLLIGVDDDGTISGLKFAEEEKYAMEAAINRLCRPAIKYDSEIIPVSRKKSIIQYTIFESEKKPHYVLEKNGVEQKGRAYIRVKDRSIQASREIREILRRSRRNKDIKFNYGDKETILMQYLENQGSITVGKFAEVAKLSRYKASRTLVLLVLANVLEVIPREKEDLYIAHRREYADP